MYPNPTTDYLMISGLSGTSTVTIYTLTGQAVLEQTFDSQIRLTMELAKGMYLVKVKNNGNEVIKKIVIK